MNEQPTRAERAARHAALGDPVRLAIVDELVHTDRSPAELRARLGIASNLLAHHLDVLEGVGLILRGRSSGDGRRRYVHLRPPARELLASTGGRLRAPALFVCTANSARSQLAAALWSAAVGEPADSAGTEPAARVHPGAVAAARRAGVDLTGARPRALGDLDATPALVVTVCDRAHESLPFAPARLHWSIPDPAGIGTAAAFDGAVAHLRRWIDAVAA